jgi:hypothetical protein
MSPTVRRSYRWRSIDDGGKDAFVPWIFGGAALYIVLMVTLGIVCIRNGHWVMFIIGLFLPFFWLIGAIMRPRRY